MGIMKFLVKELLVKEKLGGGGVGGALTKKGFHYIGRDYK